MFKSTPFELSHAGPNSTFYQTFFIWTTQQINHRYSLAEYGWVSSIITVSSVQALTRPTRLNWLFACENVLPRRGVGCQYQFRLVSSLSAVADWPDKESDAVMEGIEK